ncbi:MAG: TonB-dependent receptor [Mangrovibacterium sp.]
MKVTVFLLTISILGAFASGTYSQTTKLTLQFNNTALEKVLGEIENQSEFRFFYNENVNVRKEVTVSSQNESVFEILDYILGGTGIKYRIIGRQIALYNQDENFNPAAISSGAQVQVQGRVTDSSGTPLPGVTVAVKNTTQGTITDASGNYSLPNVSGDATLVFSFVGMKMQEIAVSGKTSMNVIMVEETVGIEEVVAIGYGTQKKVNLIGSVATVSSQVLENRPVTNLSSALTGLSSGVYVYQGSGKPGEDGATIRIRGLGTLNSNTALVVVDGIPSSLDAVNPDDVENISILKDAAAASIYGARASNGVILVTTKKGSKNKISVTYSGSLSLSSPSRIPEFVTNYARHMELINEGYENSGIAPVFSQTTIDTWREKSKDPNGLTDEGIPNYVAYPNTDWADAVFQNKALQKHTISVNGGTEKSTFLLSMGYLNNPGTIARTGYERYQMRFNLQTEVAKFLTVGTQTYGQLSSKGMASTSSAFKYLGQTTPGLYPCYDGKYGYPSATEESPTANNILAMLYDTDGDNKSTSFNTTMFANLRIVDGLMLESKVNYNTDFTESNAHTHSYERWNFLTNESVEVLYGTPANLTTGYSFGKDYMVTLESLLRYNKTFNEKHDFGALLGYNQYYYNYYNFNTTKQGLIDETITTLGSATSVLSSNGDEYDYAMRSWFGRLNYAYKSKYLLEAVCRYDGSSRFSSDNRWGFFPAFSAGWRLSEESFMNQFKGVLDNLKLRLSWGKTGNNATNYNNAADNYLYQATYSSTYYSFGGSESNGLAVTQLANPKLKWETTTLSNLGLDGTLFGGALDFELDLYRKYTDGILYTPTIPLTVGTASAAVENIAEVLNKGIEMTVGHHGKIGQVEYHAKVNFAYNYNRVKKYKGALESGWDESHTTYSSNLGDVSSGSDTRVVEGHPISEYYLLDVYKGDGTYYNTDGSVNINGGPKDGMIRTENDMAWLQSMMTAGYSFQPGTSISKTNIYYGDLIYADKNGDGSYGNTYDKIFTGKTAIPKYNFGFSGNLAYKNFDMSFIFSGSAGMSYLWNDMGYTNSLVMDGYGVSCMIADDHYFYDPTNSADSRTNINGKYPRLREKNSEIQNNVSSTFYLFNASYIKLKNLQIGYSLPKTIISKLRMERARVYVSGENLFMITNYPILDPEVGSGMNYPTMRQISLGINVSF